MRMLDSIYVANLPPGADAYLGYVDGAWPTFPALKARFPGAHVLSMAVFASGDAEGCDCETGDLTAAEVPAWVKRQQARGIARPVVYASAGIMASVLAFLHSAGIPRASVRLLSAHYGAGKHICGSGGCAYPEADGTQFTDHAAGVNGTWIDESVLAGDFFDGGDMALTGAEITAIADASAKAVMALDVIPSGNPSNPGWTLPHAMGVVLADAAGSAGDVAAAVLKGLDPASIAAVIAASLGPDIGREVLDELSARLAG